MKMKANVYSFALVILVIVYSEDSQVAAQSSSQIDSNLFVAVLKGQIPTSGTTSLRVVTLKSMVSCGNLCSQSTGPDCTGFVFQKTICGISSKAGTCQLLSFASLTAVTLGSSTNACQIFYVRQSSSIVDITTTTTGQALLTSTTPLATTTDVITTTTQSVPTTSTPVATTTLPSTVVTTSKVQSVSTTPTPMVTTTAQSLNPIWTYTIQGIAEGIRCITSYSGYLYVTRAAKTTNQIAVYNATSFQLVRYITVTGATGELYGMVMSPTNDFLYVSDFDNSNIYKVNMSSLTNIKTWSVATNPNGITLNRLNNLLVAGDSGKIQEFTTGGVLVREITDGNQLNDVKGLSDGTFAITRYGSVHGVALLSNNGTVLYSFGSTTTGSGPGQMYWPAALSVNSQGYVIVVDYKNNRIQVLNPTLSQARTVSLPVSGLNGPYSMWLDESRGQLYVGEVKSPYRLLVFTNFYNLNAAFVP